MNMVLLTSIDEIMTCYLSGFKLNEEAQQLCTRILNGTQQLPVKIVDEWPVDWLRSPNTRSVASFGSA
ncbi:MAG: hypothetical protein WC919_01975 [Candidatus Paceibacterota bacterium]|jgi:hypothetical protein